MLSITDWIIKCYYYLFHEYDLEIINHRAIEHFWKVIFPSDTMEYTIFSLGAGNYQQPHLPTANMADADLGAERY